jgi:hypothetical protein
MDRNARAACDCRLRVRIERLMCRAVATRKPHGETKRRAAPRIALPDDNGPRVGVTRAVSERRASKPITDQRVACGRCIDGGARPPVTVATERETPMRRANKAPATCP